ncbi:MAG: rhomboid family intramembrane serine protease [Saprospiraceae bacterium]|nr:rhomboid family intramembrane serine protease [Saprospiraceae bacterium]
MHQDYKKFLNSILIPLVLVLILWSVKLFEVISGIRLYFFGVYPREWSGFLGIFTSPFVHGTWGHLASNTLPLLILTSIMALFYRKAFLKSLVMITSVDGILAWLFARPSYHIGASGVVYGLIAFVFWTGIFKKNTKSVVLSLIVLVLYAGSVESIFPGVEKNISWESHLFGAIVGLITAFLLKSVVEEDEKQFHESPWSNDPSSKSYFLPRDIFEKTKIERYYESLLRESNDLNAGNKDL